MTTTTRMARSGSGKITFGYLIWRTLVLLTVLLAVLQKYQLVVSESNLAGNSSHKNEDPKADTVRCVCDGECERIWEEDCRWGLTLDFCGCCLLCSRGEGEPCGGALGTCAYGLYCRNEPGKIGEGTCSKPGSEKVCEKPVNRFGCLFHGGTCICENQAVCPQMEMFVFDTEESCRSRVAILMAARQADSVLPTREPQRATANCSEVICDIVQDCPADSYRLPTSVHLPESSDCCPSVQKCQCNPGHLCPKPECPPGWGEKFIVNATGEPGNCCPLLECSPPIQADRGAEERKLCSYGGRAYEPAESWTNAEECTECTCSANGVVSCQWIKCDVPPECRLARAPPDSCCPVCAGCITSGGRVYNSSETWEEDPCTLCECDGGKVRCHATVCQPGCENPVYSPGECCPRCPEPQELREEEPSCPQVDCQGRQCTRGYLLDVRGCPTCQCNECSVLHCGLDCPSGYELDSQGCPQCMCSAVVKERIGSGQIRTESTAEKSAGEARRVESQRLRPGCKSLDGKRGVIVRAESDEWWDGCRHCVCRDGLEMCTLISCNPPECEHPIFYPGDCCPRCPGDEVTTPREIDTTCTATSAPGVDPWEVNQCLTCSCHNSLVVCSHPICPPAPCEVQPNTLSTAAGPPHPPCCQMCAVNHNGMRAEPTPSSSPKIDGVHMTWAKVGNISSSNGKCFSDDNLQEYEEGETWTTGPCQSCVCRSGKIECFSSWRSCPSLSCDQPIFAKNQCCPICLELIGSSAPRRTSELNPLVAVVLVVTLCLVFILALFALRFVFRQRSSRRRLGDNCGTKPAPNYC